MAFGSLFLVARFVWALPWIVIGSVAVGGLVEIGEGFTVRVTSCR